MPSSAFVSRARKYRPPVLFEMAVSVFSSRSAEGLTRRLPKNDSTIISSAPIPMVYIFRPSCAASSAALIGSISPAVFAPSVNRISTRLLISLSRRRFTARPIASPMAVSLPARPMADSFNSVCTVRRSNVNGVCK